MPLIRINNLYYMNHMSAQFDFHLFLLSQGFTPPTLGRLWTETDFYSSLNNVLRQVSTLISLFFPSAHQGHHCSSYKYNTIWFLVNLSQMLLRDDVWLTAVAQNAWQSLNVFS